MKKITFNEIKNTYKIKPLLAQAMEHAHNEGFAVYVTYLNHGKVWRHDITYFKTIWNDGERDLIGCVTEKYFGGLDISMPIKPSQDFGSSMFLGHAKGLNDGMTWKEYIMYLPLLKNKFNCNSVVGQHENYNDIRFIEAEGRTEVIF